MGVNHRGGNVAVRVVVDIFQVLLLDGTQREFLVRNPVTGRARATAAAPSAAGSLKQRAAREWQLNR
jgi:hypothetical protein